MFTINLDDKEYMLDQLSDDARAEATSIQAVDGKLEALKANMAIYQTARNAYAASLQSQLPEKTAHANKKKGVIEIDDKKYALEDFSDDAKAKLVSLQAANAKLAEAQSQMAMMQTARNAYSLSLKSLLAA